MENKAEILAKIRKLITKRDSAEKIGNQAEANAFASKITELLAKYNIELAQLHQDTEDDTSHEILMRVELERRHEGKWVTTLLQVLCKYNFCTFYISGEYDGYKYLDGQYVFIGQEHNREIVKYMLTYLIEAGRELGRKGLLNNPGSKRNSYLRAFYDGFVTAIYGRLREDQYAQHQADKQFAQQYGLVVRSQEEKNTALMKKLAPNIRYTKSNSRGYGDHNGKTDGYEAGKNISLNKGVGSGTNSLNQKLLG